jgi:hypothetical protein
MESSSDKISSQKVVEELFEQLGNVLSRPVRILVIGGAAMIEYGLKDSTKDIDIVCGSEEDKEEILSCAEDLGYALGEPEKRHERLVVDRIAKKGGQTLDVFAGRISYDFGLSNAMWERSRKQRVFGKADVRYASSEDIFIMKLIANRPGDAPDCAALFSSGLDFEAVYVEIESQYRKAGGSDQKWISHVEEGIARLVDNYDMIMPKEISDKISYLAYDYNERL